MRRRPKLAISCVLLGLLALLVTGTAEGAELAFVLGTILEPEGANEGDQLAPGTLVRAGNEALVMVEHRWPSDVASRDCVLLEIFGYGKSHRVSAEETPGRCETTAPNLASLEDGEPFLSRETRYGDAKFDEMNPPQQVARSDARWRGFDRWLRDARRSFTGEVDGVRGDTLRLRSPASGRVTVFAVDPASVHSPLPLDELVGKEVRVDYRMRGHRPQVERIEVSETAAPVAVVDTRLHAEIVAPLESPRPQVEVEADRPTTPRPGGTTPKPEPAQETWSCTIDLHQGDTGTLWFRRHDGAVDGSIVVRDGSRKHRISGTWKGDRIEFWRALSEASGQPFVGTAGTTESGAVRMAGRFAHELSGVWSADCRRSDRAARAPGTVNVILVDAGDSKLRMIKTVRELTGMGLKESRDAVESLPFTVAAGVSEDEAKEISYALTVAGGRVEIEPAG